MAKFQEWITEEGLLLISGWAKDGLTDKQIAENIGISERCFNTWKKKHNSISSVLKESKVVADRNIENALYKSATGFYYDEQVIIDGGVIQTLRKFNKPNVTAQIFWLKNRKPANWRDKTETDVEIKNQKFDDIIAQLGGKGLEE